MAVLCAALFLPGGPLFESFALRIALTVLTFVTAAASVSLVISSGRVFFRTVEAAATAAVVLWRNALRVVIIALSAYRQSPAATNAAQ